jgi:hypothetical protein
MLFALKNFKISIKNFKMPKNNAIKLNKFVIHLQVLCLQCVSVLFMICCSTKRKKKQVQAVIPIVIGPDGTPIVQPEVVQPDEFEPTCCERIVKCCHKKETVKAVNQFSNNLFT